MATEPKKIGYEEMLSQIMSKMEGLESQMSTMQLELNNANLRAENAELKLAVSAGGPTASKPVIKPLGRGKNRTNRWLNEMVTYSPPRSYDQKDIYFDVASNGKTWRLMRARANKVPRFIALIAMEREKREDELTAKLNGMVQEFENASANDFKEAVVVPNRIR